MKKMCFISLFFLFLSLFHLQISGADPQEDELFSTAQRAFDDGFHDVAIKYLEEYLPKYSQSPKLNDAKLLLGQCYFLKNNFTKAEAIFGGMADVSNDKDAILFWQGETNLKLSNYNRARIFYQNLVDHYPSSSFVVQALYSQAWSYFDEKNFAMANMIFNKLITQFPKHPLVEDSLFKIGQGFYNVGDYLNAIKSFEQYTSRYTSFHNAQIYLNIADAYYFTEDFNQSLTAYEKVLKITQDPVNMESAYVGKVWCLIKKKDFDQAEKIVKDGIEFAQQKNLSLEDLYLGLGQLMYEKGDWQSAVNAYGDLLGHYPDGVRRLEAYLGRANAYYMQKSFTKAADDFKFIINHRSSNSDVDILTKATLGLGWSLVKNGSYEEGFKQFHEVYKINTDYDEQLNALVQLSDAYQDGGRFEDALNVYEEISRKMSQNVFADYVQYRKGIAYLKLERFDAAQEAFSMLEQSFPQSKYLEDKAYYMGILAFKKGNWLKASQSMEVFLKALTGSSDFAPEANYILGLSLLNLKQTEEALKVFQRISRLYPDDEIVAKNSDIGIAKCQFELGQIKEAVKRFKLIVFKYPKTDVQQEALLWLAQYAMKNASYDEAIDFYSQIIAHFSNYSHIDQIHYELAQAYEMLGNSENALAQFSQVSGQDQALASKSKLAIAGIFSKEFDPKKAISAYQSIADSNPDYARDAYLKIGQLYRNAQNMEDEIGIYVKALKMEFSKSTISNAEIYFNLGDAYEAMSKMEEAIEQYLKIPAQYSDQIPWVVKAYLRVAKIFEDRKDWEGSRLTYQKIIQLKTDESKYAQERLDFLKKK